MLGAEKKIKKNLNCSLKVKYHGEIEISSLYVVTAIYIVYNHVFVAFLIFTLCRPLRHSLLCNSS